MTIKQFTPIGIAVFLAICGLARYSHIVPVAPVAIISFVALTGLAFLCEDGRILRMLRDLADAFRYDREHHAH